MSVRRILYLGAWFLGAALVAAPPAAANRVLVAFGPGGPHQALLECAERFREQSGIDVAVIKAREEALPAKLRDHGDLYYGGAEYMLEELAASHPDLLDLDTKALLPARRIGVVVRSGNPHGIEGIDDLGRDGVHLLAVRLERMEPFHPSDALNNGKVARLVHTGREGLAAWRSLPELDAWVTYRSWYRLLEAEAEFIELPSEQALRHTPVAVTRRTPHREAAQAFIEFLQSPEARQIFEEYGWD